MVYDLNLLFDCGVPMFAVRWFGGGSRNAILIRKQALERSFNFYECKPAPRRGRDAAQPAVAGREKFAAESTRENAQSRSATVNPDTPDSVKDISGGASWSLPPLWAAPADRQCLIGRRRLGSNSCHKTARRYCLFRRSLHPRVVRNCSPSPKITLREAPLSFRADMERLSVHGAPGALGEGGWKTLPEY